MLQPTKYLMIDPIFALCLVIGGMMVHSVLKSQQIGQQITINDGKTNGGRCILYMACCFLSYFPIFVFFVVRIRVLSIAIAFQCIVQLKTFLYWCYIIYLFWTINNCQFLEVEYFWVNQGSLQKSGEILYTNSPKNLKSNGFEVFPN